MIMDESINKYSLHHLSPTSTLNTCRAIYFFTTRKLYKKAISLEKFRKSLFYYAFCSIGFEYRRLYNSAKYAKEIATQTTPIIPKVVKHSVRVL